jgi:hypothetical protein
MSAPADTDVVTELAIVDLFTKLIFGGEQELSVSEMRILRALREVDSGLLLHSERDVGFYLRALGVSDMIALVNRVQGQLQAAPAWPATTLQAESTTLLRRDS